jgi:hypothetical protein
VLKSLAPLPSCSVFGQNTKKMSLSSLKDVVGADYAAGTFHQVLPIIVLDATEQKLSGERGQVDQARQDDHLVER